jgi:hypothetical protein
MYAIRFEYPGLVALVRRRLVGTRVDITLGSGSELRNVHVQGKKNVVGVISAGLSWIFLSASLWMAGRSGCLFCSHGSS